jgi:capsular exopolysaccharide synthesis family protein
LQTNAASKLSTVIYLAIKDEVPQKAEDILNKILETYDLFSIRQKNKIADNTLAFVQDRLHYVESDLDSIESTIQRFKSREKVTNLGEQGRLYLQSVGDNDNKTANISVQMAVLDQVEKFVLGNDNKASIIPASFGINDPVLSSMLQSLRDDELKYDILVKTAGENNPSAVTIAREIENLRPQLMQVLRNQRSALEASRNQLANNKGIYDSQLISLPQKERQLLDISRRQNIKNDVYTFLLQKREETALSYASTVADSWIISPAQSTYLPVWPNKIFVLLIAIVLSVLISAGLVTKKEVMNKKVLFRNEISEVTNVPIVAELFNVKRKKRLAVTQDKGSVIAEQLRKLRASVGIYGNNTSIKKILITSSISGEGKSFVSSNLGLNLAFSGKKVLLMDLDLRNPMISSIVGMEGGPGISDYLEGKCQTHEIVFTTSHKNLYAISAGSEAVNPTELLLNGKIGDLLNELDKEFDYIIMDTSPIASVSDAYLLSEYCDITLFLVKHRFTPKKLVQMLEENIRSKALRNVYIVFNGIKPRGMFTKKYGYGYGYGYEYVYKIKRRKSTRHAVIA